MSSRLHLVTDFDGVWTEPERELEQIRTTLASELARLSGRSLKWVEQHLEDLTATVMGEPERHGWHVEGGLTSYVDEDYFGVPAAVGRALEHAGHEDAMRVREAVLGEFASLSAFLDHCYHSTCERFRLSVDHDLTPGAERVLHWLLGRGVRVTFVTNAPTSKVIDWFDVHGHQVADARDPSSDGAALRAYGRAGKQWLGDSGRYLDFAGRRVWTDRPLYRAILERERPDVVLGDVLSLDLALPLGMRAEGAPAAPRMVVLLHRTHTPAWVRAAVGPGPHQIDRVLHHVTELPNLVVALESAGSASSG